MTKPFFIAEIGINHDGSRQQALDLIKMAADAGADAVKFQKRTVDIVYARDAEKPRKSAWGEKTIDQKRALEFGRRDYELFFAQAAACQVDCFASAWDLEALAFIESFDPAFHKIASAMLTHKALVREVAMIGKHTFISTGMATWRLIDEVVEVFKETSTPFTLLHCVACYPVLDPKLLNLRLIPALKERYKCRVGYSGHETGLSPSVAAIALGAEAIERHITANRGYSGSDHGASVEIGGFRKLVTMCLEVSEAMGDGKKRFLNEEKAVAQKLRYWE